MSATAHPRALRRPRCRAARRSSGSACGCGCCERRGPSKARCASGCASSFSITLPQFDVLAALAATDAGMTMTELSRMLMVSNGNVTGIIERLAADGPGRRGRPRPTIAAPFTSASRGEAPTSSPRWPTIHEAWVDELLAEFTRADTETLIAHLDGLAGRIREGGRGA